MQMSSLSKFLLTLTTLLIGGVCLSEEIKRAKIGDYEYSYYVETNGTAGCHAISTWGSPFAFIH